MLGGMNVVIATDRREFRWAIDSLVQERLSGTASPNYEHLAQVARSWGCSAVTANGIQKKLDDLCAAHGKQEKAIADGLLEYFNSITTWI